AAIANVARMRFFSPQDIGGSSTGSASLAVRNARAILQNTLEQVVLAVPVHVALAAVFVTSVPLVFALTVLFAVGRILFWIGYPIGAPARSFGFALTFYPTMVGVIIAVLGLVMR
ncbi:MAG TPA: MAPEG family protein, partial [Pararhizobium sp.]|nr:MAPEG family protein [Pararhizobium sp.]